MTRARSLAILATLAGAVPLIVACGPKKPAPAPTRPSQAVVVLLPDSETGVTGRVNVGNTAGTTELKAERESTTVVNGSQPAAVTVLSEDEIKRMFGPALAARPPAPHHFTLYFKFESDELTDDSKALLPEILDTVKQRAVPEVVVVGHTDTMGAARANVDLGLKRATMVRDQLVGVGLNPALIEVTSHGEADLLIATPDETPEPRNRRVEISVR
jgi:outer membrane protein OmpA-like peptidoglycan-associated protein